MKPKKSLDDRTIEELLEELRKSQGPGDALLVIGTDRSMTLTTGKTQKKNKMKKLIK